MSTTAYIVPYDHQSTGQSIAGIDAAQLWATTPQGDKPPKAGTTRVFYNTPVASVTSVVSLGDKFAAKKANDKRELVRKAVGSAVKELKGYDGVKEVTIDASADPHAAGASSFLVVLVCRE